MQSFVCIQNSISSVVYKINSPVQEGKKKILKKKKKNPADIKKKENPFCAREQKTFIIEERIVFVYNISKKSFFFLSRKMNLENIKIFVVNRMQYIKLYI